MRLTSLKVIFSSPITEPCPNLRLLPSRSRQDVRGRSQVARVAMYMRLSVSHPDADPTPLPLAACRARQDVRVRMQVARVAPHQRFSARRSRRCQCSSTTRQCVYSFVFVCGEYRLKYVFSMEVNFDLCLEDLRAAEEDNPPIYHNHSDFGSGSLRNIEARKEAWESVLSTLIPDYENQPKKN